MAIWSSRFFPSLSMLGERPFMTVSRMHFYDGGFSGRPFSIGKHWRHPLRDAIDTHAASRRGLRSVHFNPVVRTNLLVQQGVPEEYYPKK